MKEVIFWAEIFFWVVVPIVSIGFYYKYESVYGRDLFVQLGTLYYNACSSAFLRTDFVANLDPWQNLMVIALVIFTIACSFAVFYNYEYDDRIHFPSGALLVVTMFNIINVITELLIEVYKKK